MRPTTTVGILAVAGHGQIGRRDPRENNLAEIDFDHTSAGDALANRATVLAAVREFPRLLWKCTPAQQNDPEFIAAAIPGAKEVLERVPGLKPISDLALLKTLFAADILDTRFSVVRRVGSVRCY